MSVDTSPNLAAVTLAGSDVKSGGIIKPPEGTGVVQSNVIEREEVADGTVESDLADVSRGAALVLSGRRGGVPGAPSRRQRRERFLKSQEPLPVEPEPSVDDVRREYNAAALAEQPSPFESLDLSGIFPMLLEENTLKELGGFLNTEVLPHAEAKAVLIDMFAERLAGKEMDVDKILARKKKSAFYSPKVSEKDLEGMGDSDSKEARKRIREVVERMANGEFFALCDDPNSPYFFTKVDSWGQGGLSAGTAARSPRVVKGSSELGFESGNLIEVLRSRLVFMELCHRAIKSLLEDLPFEYHRETYEMAQEAAKATLEHSNEKKGEWVAIPPRGRLVPAPSLKLFKDRSPENTDDLVVVDNYITANLSLIFPDKKDLTDQEDECPSLIGKDGKFANLAQEEFIIFDLIALADKYGLYEKYKKIFEAIFDYRRVHMKVNVYFDPKAANNHDPNKKSLIDIARSFYESNGELPFVGDWGEGRGHVLKTLISLGVVKGGFGIDIDAESDQDLVTVSEGGKYTSVKLGVKGLSSQQIKEKVIEKFPQVDILFGCDVAHECSDPVGYIVELAKKVKQGGYMHFTDPIHCETVDNVTKVTVYKFDSSTHETSMIPLEVWNNLLAYFTLHGMKVLPTDVAPGVVAGNNDTYWRAGFTLKVPKEEERDPNRYDPPKQPEIDWHAQVLEIGDFFKVWPLSLVPEEARSQIIPMLVPYLGLIGSKLSDRTPPETLQYKNARRTIALAMASIDADISQSNTKPHVLDRETFRSRLRKYDRLAYFKKVADFVGYDKILERRRDRVKEVLFLVMYLRDKFGIDISEEVKKQPEWAFLRLPDPKPSPEVSGYDS